MFEIKVTVDPALIAAINALSGAITGQLKISTACNAAATVQTTAPVAPVQNVPTVPTAPAAVPTAPVQTAPTAPIMPAAAPSVPVQTAPPPAPVPTSAPTFTMEQISRAGTMLIDMGKMNDLMALLARYGVAAITQLKPESYGAVATELRALGAQI